jgi:hypothetical protein
MRLKGHGHNFKTALLSHVCNFLTHALPPEKVSKILSFVVIHFSGISLVRNHVTCIAEVPDSSLRQKTTLNWITGCLFKSLQAGNGRERVH